MNGFDRFLIQLKKTTQTWNLYALSRIKRYQIWDKLLAFAFKYSSRCYTRKTPLIIEKHKNPNNNLKYFSDNFGRFSTSKSLIGVVTEDQKDVIVTQHLLKMVYQSVKCPKTCELCCLEILAKVLAYRTLQENQEILIPIRIDEETIKPVVFVVDTLFDLWHSHVAFGLRAKESPEISPILLFRGTDFTLGTEGGRASILSDLDPDGPGRRLFLSCRSTIRQWLHEMVQFGQKPRILGHSLGGALVKYTCVYEHSLVSKNPFQASYAFNSPGVTEDVIKEWSDLSNEEKPELISLVTRGDIVSKFGKIFGQSYELFTSKPLSPMIAHEQMIFSQPLCYMAQIEIEKENETSSRRYYSLIQKQTTSLAYQFGLKFLFPNLLIS